MSTAELLARMNALEQRAEQSWTSQQDTLSVEMNSVAGDGLEIQRSLPSEANSQLQGHQRQDQEHLQEYQQDVQRRRCRSL